MSGIRFIHLSEAQRKIIRPVALAYRRAVRAGVHEAGCTEAAMDEYYRLEPSPPADRLAASARVKEMIAAAINADSKWFWEGPDA